MAHQSFVYNPVSIGFDFAFLSADGGVWCSGAEDYGGLGMGEDFLDTGGRVVKLETLVNINFVSCGQGHSCFLNANGDVWMCGWNKYGQVGRPVHQTGIFYPEKITDIPKIRVLHTSFNHNIFLDFEGDVWTCGWNNKGQLGMGTDSPALRYTIEKVPNLPKIVAINAGIISCFFIDTEGVVWTFDKQCKIEQVTGLPPIQFVSNRALHSLFLDYNGSVWARGANSRGQLGLGHFREMYGIINVPSNEKFTAVATGASHSLFLNENGQVCVCGANDSGQLGLVNKDDVCELTLIPDLPVISFICAGEEQSVFVDTEGVCWACGSNARGELGDILSTATPTQIENLPPIIHKQTRTQSTKSAMNRF